MSAPTPEPPFAEPVQSADDEPVAVLLDEAYFQAEVERMEAEARRLPPGRFDRPAPGW